VPRQPDPDLEGNILDAAQKLWKKGGEKALTMRAVAEEAKTNTPSVYRRFKDRDDILRGLLRRIRLEIAATLEGASSPEEACERYLDYAVSHRHEYELFFQHNYELNYSPRSGVKRTKQPARDTMRRKLTEKLGESAGDHENLLTALWMMTHGAAMLLIAKSILPEEVEPARTVFRRAVMCLLSDAGEISAAGRGRKRGAKVLERNDQVITDGIGF
jgi:AcrR family transcriptional regulator